MKSDGFCNIENYTQVSLGRTVMPSRVIFIRNYNGRYRTEERNSQIQLYVTKNGDIHCMRNKLNKKKFIERQRSIYFMIDNVNYTTEPIRMEEFTVCMPGWIDYEKGGF